jgi:tetratricopeptide (TPR) repeat protein
MLGDALEIYPKPDADILRLKSSLSLRPNDPVAVNQLAILLMKQGRFGEAHETIQKGLAAESESSGALYNNLAVLYTEKKMFSRALEACRQSLEMNPENPMTVELRDVLREKVTASGLVE